MKRNLIAFLVMLFPVLALTPKVAGAQQVSDTMRQAIIEEYGKRAVSENTGALNVPQTGLTPYERDSREVAQQLKVVSDNEDLNYIIMKGDTLTIAFKDRDQINRAAYKVSEAGEVFLPLLGPVKVVDLNRKQARERIDAMLKEYIRDPKTAIAVNTDGRVMIFGAVGRPGIFNMSGKMSVMESILSAGGYNKQTAELASVIIIRGPAEKPILLKVNLKKMVTRGDRSEDVNVKPGDFIFVPTSFISNLEKFWGTFYGYLMQWYGLGGEPFIDGNP